MEKYAEDTISLEKNNHKKPLGVRNLIVDEVKVIGKVMWNSKNEFIGTVLTDDEQSNLCDQYCDNQEDQLQAASYMVQTLWRDLTSKYDLIGPYFSLASNATADKIVPYAGHAPPTCSSDVEEWEVVDDSTTPGHLLAAEDGSEAEVRVGGENSNGGQNLWDFGCYYDLNFWNSMFGYLPFVLVLIFHSGQCGMDLVE